MIKQIYFHIPITAGFAVGSYWDARTLEILSAYPFHPSIASMHLLVIISVEGGKGRIIIMPIMKVGRLFLFGNIIVKRSCNGCCDTDSNFFFFFFY